MAKFSVNTGYNISRNEQNEKKSQSSVALFKIKAHLKYLQDVARSYLCHMFLYI